MRPTERLLQLLQLKARERRPIPPLLALRRKLIHLAIATVPLRHRTIRSAAGRGIRPCRIRRGAVRVHEMRRRRLLVLQMMLLLVQLMLVLVLVLLLGGRAVVQQRRLHLRRRWHVVAGGLFGNAHCGRPAGVGRRSGDCADWFGAARGGRFGGGRCSSVGAARQGVLVLHFVGEI